MDLSMQMKALRSLNFAKLSSNSSTRDEYWVTSISAGTPAGYCLSHMRSMSFPLFVRFLGFFPLFVPGHLIILGNIERCSRRWQAAAGEFPGSRPSGLIRVAFDRPPTLAVGVGLGRRFGRLCGRLRFGRFGVRFFGSCRFVGGLRRRVGPGAGMFDRLGLGFLPGIVGACLRGLFRRVARPF